MSLSSAPAYTIAQKQYPKQNEQSWQVLNYEGPGAYDRIDYLTTNSPAWKVGNAKRNLDKSELSMTGPGSYSTNHNNIHTPSYTFSLKNKPDHVQQTPGPGQYQMMSSFMSKTGSLKFGKTKKLIAKQDYVPGPGAYQIQQQRKNKTNGVKFPRSSRSFIQTNNDQPGPGQYNLNYSPQSKLPQLETSFGMAGKNKRKKVNDTPGPGQYDVQKSYFSSLKHQKGSSMPRCDRTMYDDRFLSAHPGPGYYQLQKSVLQNSGCTIGKSKRSQHFNENPSPQKYNVSDIFDQYKKKGVKIGNQKRNVSLQKYDSNPGPGTYKNQSSIGGPQYTLSKSIGKTCIQNPNKSFIGPGQYNMPLTNYNKYVSIGTSKRHLTQKDQESPGPGMYEIRHSLKQGITFPQARKIQPINTMPGPGYYEVQTGVGNLPHYAQKTKKK